MAFFTAKEPVSQENALIGELADNGDMVWSEANFAYAWSLYKGDVLELRGSKTVNGIHYMLFYLPPPAHSYHVEP